MLFRLKMSDFTSGLFEASSDASVYLAQAHLHAAGHFECSTSAFQALKRVKPSRNEDFALHMVALLNLLRSSF